MSMRLVAAQGVVLERRSGLQWLVNTTDGTRCALNSLGGRIWSMLGTEPTFPALVSRLGGAYDGRSTLARDAGRLVVAWRDAGLVVWAN
jgi:hypothetical protein